MALLIRSLLATLLALAAGLAAAADSDARFMALSYHEVIADDEKITPTAVRASDLARQFAWLKVNDFHPVSVDQILAARDGGPPLPPRAILLTFDDGFKDAYTRAFPLLKLFNYPAVIALVGKWMDVPDGQMVDYDGEPVPRGKFLDWEQVREMQASGLVEVASHSYNLHRGILANPQGNTQPAATTRLFANGQYEDDAANLARLRHELRHACALAIRHQATFSDQLLIGEQHGVASDFQRHRQPAAGRQGRTGCQAAGQDGFAQAMVKHALPRYGFRQRRGEQPVQLHRGSINHSSCGTTKGTTRTIK